MVTGRKPSFMPSLSRRLESLGQKSRHVDADQVGDLLAVGEHVEISGEHALPEAIVFGVELGEEAVGARFTLRHFEHRTAVYRRGLDAPAFQSFTEEQH